MRWIGIVVVRRSVRPSCTRTPVPVSARWKFPCTSICLTRLYGDADGDGDHRGHSGEGERPDAAHSGSRRARAAGRAPARSSTRGGSWRRRAGRSGPPGPVARRHPAWDRTARRGWAPSGARDPGRVGGHLVGAAGEVQEVLAEGLGSPEVEEGQGERRVRTPRRLDDHPRQAEQACDERPGELDRLDTFQPHLTVLAEQHALAQLDLATADPEAGEPPGDPVRQGDETEEGRQEGQGDERVGQRLAPRGRRDRTTRPRSRCHRRRGRRRPGRRRRGRSRRSVTRHTRRAPGGRRRRAAAGTGGAAGATPPNRPVAQRSQAGPLGLATSRQPGPKRLGLGRPAGPEASRRSRGRPCGSRTRRCRGPGPGARTGCRRTGGGRRGR